MSNPDFSKDPELVECAKAVARVYSPKDEWEQFTPYMQRQLLSLCDAARTFFGSIPAAKPEPVFPMPCPSMQGDNPCEQLAGHEGPHSQGSLVWEDEPGSSKAEGPGPDFAAEAAERERRRLLEAFMHDMVSNPAVMAQMLENYEADEDAIAARLHEIALAFAQELIG